MAARGGATKELDRNFKSRAETSPACMERRFTAEQVLNHPRPPLAHGSPPERTEVRLKRGRHFHGTLEKLRGRP